MLPYNGTMTARRVVGTLFMIASVVVGVLALKVPDHRSESVIILTRGDISFWGLFAVLVSTFMTALGGWIGVLGDPRKSLPYLFFLCLGGFLIFGLGPTLAASALRKSDAWATDWRFNLTLAITGVQTISQLIKDRKKGNARAETHPGTSG